jgi:hypothetical protein
MTKHVDIKAQKLWFLVCVLGNFPFYSCFLFPTEYEKYVKKIRIAFCMHGKMKNIYGSTQVSKEKAFQHKNKSFTSG